MLFSNFLKECNHYFINNNFSEINRIKLEKYLENDSNLLFISTIIKNAVNSVSLMRNTLLAYYTSTILNDCEELQEKDYIISNGINNLYDFDIKHFVIFYEHRKNNKEIDSEKLKESFFISLDKLTSLQLIYLIYQKQNFSFSIDNDYDYDYDKKGYYENKKSDLHSYRINYISDHLYKIIEKSNILEKLQKDDII